MFCPAVMLALEAKPLGLLIMDCGLLILGLSWSAVNFKLQVVSYRMHDVNLKFAACCCQQPDAR